MTDILSTKEVFYRVPLWVPEEMKNTVYSSVASDADILIRNEDVTSKEQKNCLKQLDNTFRTSFAHLLRLLHRRETLTKNQ